MPNCTHMKSNPATESSNPARSRVPAGLGRNHSATGGTLIIIYHAYRCPKPTSPSRLEFRRHWTLATVAKGAPTFIRHTRLDDAQTPDVLRWRHNLKRAMVYIDGLNLLYGMLGIRLRKYLWLDLPAFGNALISGDQHLVGVNYFTARFKRDGTSGAERQSSQSAFLTANRRSRTVTIHESFFVSQKCECSNCYLAGPGNEDSIFTEKLTDTHIASSMIGDAVRNQYDTAILVSRDNDLAPPIWEVRELYPEKRVIVASPDANVGKLLQKAATSTFVIEERVFAESQLPDTVTARRGRVLTRPEEWSA